MGSKRTRGNCVFCKKNLTKGGMLRHLSSCKRRQEVHSDKKGSVRSVQNLYHLQVFCPYGSDYWLNLEVKGTTRLGELDDYLRSIWLECCGHLSQFYTQGRFGSEISMDEKVYSVFNKGTEITHIYDFGSSTETIIKMIDKRQGDSLTANPVFLMARNNPPYIPCENCDNNALWIDIATLYETGDYVLLCTEHGENQPDLYNDELLPIVNSPRTGVCGYTGPAEPPY